jgi:hypothetical protein
MTTMPETPNIVHENRFPVDNVPSGAPSTMTEVPAAVSRKSGPSRQLSAEQGKPVKRVAHEHLSQKDTAAPSETVAHRPAHTRTADRAEHQKTRPTPKPAVSAPSVAATPGDFRVTTATEVAGEQNQSNIHPSIENFELPDGRWRRRAGIALAIAACAAAWYLLRQKPGAIIAVPLPSPPAATEQRKQPPAPTVVHKALSSVRAPLGNAAAPLPAFIPADGRDSAYAAQHPGWERFTGTDYECRIFRENNRIKAVQVLSAQWQSLDRELLKKVLAELVGNDRYQVTSRERVKEYLVERGNVVGKADLMLYSQKSKLHAFVVSLN